MWNFFIQDQFFREVEKIGQVVFWLSSEIELYGNSEFPIHLISTTWHFWDFEIGFVRIGEVDRS